MSLAGVTARPSSGDTRQACDVSQPRARPAAAPLASRRLGSVALVTGWVYSVAFITVVSIYANIASHLAAWRADVPTARRHSG